MSVTTIPAAAKTVPWVSTPGRPELLSPAGDWDCARAAVENGADAIYFGLDKFNAKSPNRQVAQSCQGRIQSNP